MTDLDLLDCIAHGTTREDFLASFRGANKAERAAKHLRNFYIENGGDADKTQLDEAERKVRKYFESL